MEFRSITDAEVPALREALHLPFGGDAALDPTGDERFRALVERGRGFCAFDGPLVVGTAATFSHTLVVPGGTVAMAGLTMVGVRPTHRRRGVLRGLIELHLGDARRRGEPISGLWASEAAIYGRFGYGVAAEVDDVTFHAAGLEVAIPGGEPDRVDLIGEDDAAEQYPPLFTRALGARPGVFLRTGAWWTWRRFRDRPDLRKGASPRRFAIARRDGIDTGWLTFRQRLAWEDGLPAGTVEVEEFVGIDGRAEASLWRLAASIDLHPRVHCEGTPVDSILPWIVSDARRVRRRRSDTLWLRPDDIPVLLAARRYAADGALRLAVDEAIFELTVEGGAARCARTDAAPDVRLGRAALGSLTLGGVAPETLARAGHLAGSDAAVATCGRIFSWPIAPWCQEMF